MRNQNSVIIKSNKHGLIIILDDKISFHELLQNVADKFREAADFFKDVHMAVVFEGRELTHEEENEIIYTIIENCRIHIVCVIGNNQKNEEFFRQVVERKEQEIAAKDGQFYKGTLRSGQVLETETSVIVIGDVNPGASIVSKGNIIVLGTLKGNVYAGASGNNACFIVALAMHPLQIKIGEYAARNTMYGRASEKEVEINPKIAFVQEGHIQVKVIQRDILGEMDI
jgi:septum site-determining protein MinC